jgi:hypothetical protein
MFVRTVGRSGERRGWTVWIGRPSLDGLQADDAHKPRLLDCRRTDRKMAGVFMYVNNKRRHFHIGTENSIKLLCADGIHSMCVGMYNCVWRYQSEKENFQELQQDVQSRDEAKRTTTRNRKRCESFFFIVDCVHIHRSFSAGDYTRTSLKTSKTRGNFVRTAHPIYQHTPFRHSTLKFVQV